MTEPDDEFSTRLTQVLRSRTELVVPSDDLASGARERRRSRARGRLVGAATATVVVAAIGATFVVQGNLGGDAAPSGLGHSTPDRSWIPVGFRSESYGDIELAVPKTWTFGNLAQPCNQADPDLPMYERPGGVSLANACPGPEGYGVQLTEPREVDPDAIVPDHMTVDGTKRQYHQGAAIRTKVIGKTMVLVVLPDAALADQVIATVRRITGVDANGCPPRVGVPDVGRAETVSAGRGPLGVCRYSNTGSESPLEQSELLTGRDAAALRTAIDAAPISTGTRADCTDREGLPPDVALVVGTEGAVAWVHLDCPNTVDLGSTTRDLTAEVVYWVLSPGYSGRVPEVVRNDDLEMRPLRH